MRYLEEYKKVEQQRYDAVAHLYDKETPKNPDLGREEFVQFKLLKEHSSRHNYHKVLELACGTGRYFNFVKCNALFGLDISMNMLRKAQKKRFNKPVFLAQADLFNIPLKDNQFDLVYSIGTLGYHAPLTAELLLEIGRVLKKKGTFIFTSNVGDNVSFKHRLFFWLKALAEQLLPFCPSVVKKAVIKKIGFGRYTHTRAHIANLLNRAGFSVEELKLVMPSVWPQYYVVACNEKR